MPTTVWKGQLVIRDVTLPVKLVAAARSEAISFNQLHAADHSRVKQVIHCQLEDRPIPRSEIVKGYEYEKDRYLVLDDDDIKNSAPDSAKELRVLQFVRSVEVDPIYFAASYYIAPAEGGERFYSLLLHAMRETKYFAVTRIAMHQREHLAVLRPGANGIVLQTLFYSYELRSLDEFRAETRGLDQEEKRLTRRLIRSMRAPWAPEQYKDRWHENLFALIISKSQNPTEDQPVPVEVAVTEDEIDVIDLLKKSVKQLRPTEDDSADFVDLA